MIFGECIEKHEDMFIVIIPEGIHSAFTLVIDVVNL